MKTPANAKLQRRLMPDMQQLWASHFNLQETNAARQRPASYRRANVEGKLKATTKLPITASQKRTTALRPILQLLDKNDKMAVQCSQLTNMRQLDKLQLAEHMCFTKTPQLQEHTETSAGYRFRSIIHH
ncbi:hypothetical protein KIN20_030298 [Parelaphostrongylus tenuis]|uniref:Uncharacterized protein n=1 Tax=Parelaphostrongylus tenuis TaxID=148309 RepID=A0AAD5WGR6_PARTN|nr:hypothetical protein KIN20_030298 [Parelaphostrongylus tenuis]